MITCTRRIQFCAGHRVYGHENKCGFIHGHNYVAYIEAQADLDSMGRVVDFSVLKNIVGGWIDRNWDHQLILWCEDPLVGAMLNLGQKVYPVPDNPTAENLAKYLLIHLGKDFEEQTGVRIIKIRMDETENCSAEIS